MRGLYSNQSNQNRNARRRQFPHLSAAMAVISKAIIPCIGSYWVPRNCQGKLRSLAMAMVLVLLAGGGAGHQSQAYGSATEAQVAVDKEVASPAPSPDWGDDVLQLAYRLLEIMAEMKDAINGLGNEGPLESPYISEAEANLDDAEGIIAQILDPFQPPYLTPVDAGSVDSSVQPDLLSEYADDCDALAYEAWQAADAVDPNDVLIGTNLKTIEALLPGYRTEAGIE